MASTVAVDKLFLTIHLAHDDEAGVWYVASSDIPGLFLEAATPQDLIARVSEAAPEMIGLNRAAILAAHDVAVGWDAPQVFLRPIFDSPMDAAFA